MCLIVLGWDIHPKYKLILAANRDEFFDRPTAAAHFWEDHPHILGGRDLKANGSWMTVSRKGKFAAVTNYRDPSNIKAGATSRGEIPTNFLNEKKDPFEYLKSLHEHSGEYNGFNVLVSDQENMLHYSNYERKLNVIDRGIHGLSNALLDTNWPKVQRAKALFEEVIDNHFEHEDLIGMMGNEEVADDSILPSTGVPHELEKALSAMCIRTENYGTCCSTVVTIDRDGIVSFTEKSYPVGERKGGTAHYEFKIEK